MNPNDPNIHLLEIVSARLGNELCSELVFVGGAVTGLLITDPAMPSIRPTEDVDTVCGVQALSEYHGIEDKLRGRGFIQDLGENAPIFRWRAADMRSIIVDVMPTLEGVLEFSNRWYPMDLETAIPILLPSGRGIRLISAPVFVATKLEAFIGRGNGDFLSSHDLEDLLAVIDGRASLLRECQVASPELRAYLAERFGELLEAHAFIDSLPGHLPGDAASQARLPQLIDDLKQIASL